MMMSEGWCVWVGEMRVRASLPHHHHATPSQARKGGRSERSEGGEGTVVVAVGVWVCRCGKEENHDENSMLRPRPATPPPIWATHSSTLCSGCAASRGLAPALRRPCGLWGSGGVVGRVRFAAFLDVERKQELSIQPPLALRLLPPRPPSPSTHTKAYPPANLFFFCASTQHLLTEPSTHSVKGRKKRGGWEKKKAKSLLLPLPRLHTSYTLNSPNRLPPTHLQFFLLPPIIHIYHLCFHPPSLASLAFKQRRTT